MRREELYCTVDYSIIDGKARVIASTIAKPQFPKGTKETTLYGVDSSVWNSA